MKYKMLIINLGSTSTKIAVYNDLEEKFKVSIKHSQDELSRFHDIWEQNDFRKEKILRALKENGYNLKDFNCIACRGGNVKPVPSGTYLVNEKMLVDIRSEKYGVHPSGVGNIIAFELGKTYGIPVITADPPVTDELCSLAKYSGIKEITRISSGHALNQKRTARKIANELGKKYDDMNLIIAHLGGGISVGAHEKGRMIDFNNALDGDGSFSPERAGTLPAGDLIRMCFSGKYTEKEMIKKIKGNGGLMSYLGTNSGLEVEKRIKNGDEYALEVFEAMAFQVSKEIGAAAAVLKGKVDAIVLTGGLAYLSRFTNWIKERTKFIAPVYLCPGENEMVSLAESALRYLKGEEKAKKY
ncbi:butyrate kinase [Clostridium sp. WLY-B-L2]|uniref:Probable butyrate kinase n=1 Tax=Clostridium aromativorans TaxID=2836848 RepID=A0ABS8NA46_9CLOT|nr:butyrate kinase [Clostridium aromativorans]MCC9296668.1 butyrate kinase [Clostridium aromativorans]